MTRLLPIQAVSRVDDDGVHVEHAREQVKHSPGYDPELEHDHDYDEVYGHYGHPPFWAGARVRSGSPTVLDSACGWRAHLDVWGGRAS